MTRGKSICSVLKTIRKQVAEANEIKYEPRECHHTGECRGTCPACEAEVRYIERQLDIRRQLGKAVAVVGISVGLSALTGCGDKTKKVEYQSPVDSVIVEERKDTAKVRTAKFKPQPNASQSQSEQNNDGNFEVLGSVETRVIPEPVPPMVGEVPYIIQEEEFDDSKVFDVVEEMPSFPGGFEALMKFIDSVKVYPVVAQENGIQGRVILAFVVEKDGSLTDIKVVKSVDPALDKEAVRVVKKMPKWHPGKQNGVCVKVKYVIPVTFRLAP